jgi:hypothetical protein
MKLIYYAAKLLLLCILSSYDVQAAVIIKPLNIKKNIYLVKLKAAEFAEVSKGAKVDIRFPNSDLILDGKVLGVKKNLAKIKFIDSPVRFKKGSRFKVTKIGGGSTASRGYLNYVGSGLSILITTEYHSNSDLLYGGLLNLSMFEIIELEADAMMGVHHKTNGQSVSITTATGKLKIFFNNLFNIASGVRYKIYQLDKPIISSSSPTAEEATTETSETPYSYHDESALYLNTSVGLRYNSTQSLIGEGFSFSVDIGTDFLISPIEETIPNYDPLDPDLIGLEEGMTLWGKVSLGYFF